MVAGVDVDSADVLAVDGEEVPVDERRCVGTEPSHEFLQVLAEQVSIARLPTLRECSVVVLEPVDGAVVGDAD